MGDIAFDDGMFLQEGSMLFNRAIMSKFVFRVGAVLIVFSKEPAFGNGGTPWPFLIETSPARSSSG